MSLGYVLINALLSESEEEWSQYPTKLRKFSLFKELSPTATSSDFLLFLGLLSEEELQDAAWLFDDEIKDSSSVCSVLFWDKYFVILYNKI